MKKIVILISGRGSNMQAIIRAARDEKRPVGLVAVISNRADATGLRLASELGIATTVVSDKNYATRGAFDTVLQATIDRYQPDLLVLAGFMRILSAAFVQHYAGRILNIHPSLLPCFPGLATHRQALNAGATSHGATVHFVTVDVDHGPVVSQASIAVLCDDTEATLATRVLELEHLLYPAAVCAFIEGRLQLRDGVVHSN